MPKFFDLSINDFLNLVANHEHEKVSGFLKQNSGLLLQRGRLTDPSNRSFASISGLGYAIWSRDWTMFRNMLMCLMQGEKGKTLWEKLANFSMDEEGKVILRSILAEFQEVEQGLSYTLKLQLLEGKYLTQEFREKRFDFANTIITMVKKLEEQITDSEKSAVNLDNLVERWGGELFPVHYHDEPLDPSAEFTARPEPMQPIPTTNLSEIFRPSQEEKLEVLNLNDKPILMSVTQVPQEEKQLDWNLNKNTLMRWLGLDPADFLTSIVELYEPAFTALQEDLEKWTAESPGQACKI